MKNRKSAVTLVEAVVTLTILALGLVGVYKLYNNSIRFLDGVAAKTQAIQIAREGIEAVENIRDTNWELFPGNTEDCWRVLNYDADCSTDDTITKLHSGSNSSNYRLIKNAENRWDLEKGTLEDYTDSNGKNDAGYIKFYRIKQNDDGLYFQGGLPDNTDDKSDPTFSGKKFTRRIEISEVSDIKDVSGNMNTGLLVKSIVEWRDMSSSGVRKIELENLLTNYKK